ncbi:hypothetical protein L7F22_002383 [Adiantum nelumboides]|nr:hypothetical protein [Adiantum nelumboides]
MNGMMAPPQQHLVSPSKLAGASKGSPSTSEPAKLHARPSAALSASIPRFPFPMVIPLWNMEMEEGLLFNQPSNSKGKLDFSRDKGKNPTSALSTANASIPKDHEGLQPDPANQPKDNGQNAYCFTIPVRDLDYWQSQLKQKVVIGLCQGIRPSLEALKSWTNQQWLGRNFTLDQGHHIKDYPDSKPVATPMEPDPNKNEGFQPVPKRNSAKGGRNAKQGKNRSNLSPLLENVFEPFPSDKRDANEEFHEAPPVDVVAPQRGGKELFDDVGCEMDNPNLDMDDGELVFGKEAILPIEMQLASLKILATTKNEGHPGDQLKQRILDLEKLDLDGEMAIEHYAMQAEQRRHKFNEGFKDKELKRGMLVLRYDNRFDTRKDKKFMSRWNGFYFIRKKYTFGSYRLQDISGKLHRTRVNGWRLKSYFQRIDEKIIVDLPLESSEEEEEDEASFSQQLCEDENVLEARIPLALGEG